MRAPATDANGSLRKIVSQGRRRLRIVWLSASSSLVAPFAALVAVVIAAIGWVKPWYWPEIVAVSVFLIVIALVLVTSFLIKLSDVAVAKALDAGLKNKDAVVTAVQVSSESSFSEEIVKRATRYSRSDIRGALPFPFPWRRWAVTALLLSLLGFLVAFANPQDEAREIQAQEKAAIEEVIEEIEKLQDEEDSESEAAAQSNEELGALAERLGDTDTIDTAIDELKKSQTELLKDVGQQDLSRRAASDGLESTLQNNPLTESATGNASEQLEQVSKNVDSLSQAQKDALAERLESLAATQEQGAPEVSQQLQEAAENLRSEDASAAGNSLSEAASSVESSADAVEEKKQTEATADALGEQAEKLGEAKEKSRGQGEGQQPGEGDGQQPGQGSEGDGQGQGGEEGQGQGGQGQGNGDGDGQGQGGEGGGQGGSGKGNQPGSGEEGPTVLIPEAGESETLQADGTQSGSKTLDANQKVNGATGSGVARVPLGSVVSQFSQQASDALNQTELAPSEAATVQRYFDELKGDVN